MQLNIGSTTAGAGAGKITFNPFSFTVTGPVDPLVSPFACLISIRIGNPSSQPSYCIDFLCTCSSCFMPFIMIMKLLARRAKTSEWVAGPLDSHFQRKRIRPIHIYPNPLATYLPLYCCTAAICSSFNMQPLGRLSRSVHPENILPPLILVIEGLTKQKDKTCQ